MESPKVVTTLRSKSKNFTMHVYAYRRLSKNELMTTLATWMQQKKLTNIPNNKTVTVISLYGSDDSGPVSLTGF